MSLCSTFAKAPEARLSRRGGSKVARRGMPAVRRAAQTRAAAEADPSRVLGIILGGGAGSRLFPLTKTRSKPAVPIGGGYRLIDVPVSNCINSGIQRVFVLTQYNSTSLNRHLNSSYRSFTGNGGFVESLSAMVSPESETWFEGTADAVRQYLWEFEALKNIDNVIILSGDHLYRMDYLDFVRNHVEKNADISVGALPEIEENASGFGLMKIDGTGKIVEFAEKPKGDALKAMQVDTTVLGLSKEEAARKPYIASMGIYVFKKDVLVSLLRDKFPKDTDFGGEIIPKAAATMNVQAHLFNGYWEDIGTVKSFFSANLAMAEENPSFEFFDVNQPIYTRPRYLPPARILNCQISECILGHGSLVQDSKVHHSVVGVRSVIGDGCDIKDALLMGADYYESEAEASAVEAKGGVALGVGPNCTIRNCIIDKNARIGANCSITNEAGVMEADLESQGIYIRSGIVIVVKGATIPAGTVI